MVLPPALLESARAEFRAHGFVDANVARIAAAAGMSKKTIYKYVTSKEELLSAVMRDVVRRPGIALRTSGSGASLADRLRAYVAAFAALALSEEGIMSYRLIMSEGARFPEVARIYVDAVKQFAIAPLAEELAAGIRTGELAIADPVRSATMLMAMVVADPLRDGALGLGGPPGEADVTAWVAQAVDLFLRGSLSSGFMARDFGPTAAT